MEGHDQFREPVVLVELVHDLVDEVLLDLDLAQFIHALEEDDCGKVRLLVELTGVLALLDLFVDVPVVLLQFLMLLLQLLDFLVRIFHDLVLDLEVLHAVVHLLQVA